MKSPVKQLIGDKILVKLDEAEELTKGGIIIPDSLQEPSAYGIVVAVGNKAENLKVGDYVRVIKSSCIELEIEGVKYQLLKEQDIYFVANSNKKIKQLLGNRIALRLDKKEKVTKAGLVLVEHLGRTGEDKTPHVEGVVEFLGDKINSDVRVGNLVRFAKHTGREIDVEGDKYLFLTELDIHLILN